MSFIEFLDTSITLVGPNLKLVSPTVEQVRVGAILDIVDYAIIQKQGRHLGYTTLISTYAAYEAISKPNSVICISALNKHMASYASAIVSNILYKFGLYLNISSDINCILLNDNNSTIYFDYPGLNSKRGKIKNIDLLIVDEMMNTSVVFCHRINELVLNSHRYVFVLDSDYCSLWLEYVKPILRTPLTIL